MSEPEHMSLDRLREIIATKPDAPMTIWSWIANYIEDTENRIIDAEFKAIDMERAAARARNQALEDAALELASSYPDNVSTNAFCAAIRSMKSTAPVTPDKGA